MALPFSSFSLQINPPSQARAPATSQFPLNLISALPFLPPTKNLPRHCAVPSIIISRPHRFRYQYQHRHQRQPLTRTGGRRLWSPHYHNSKSCSQLSCVSDLTSTIQGPPGPAEPRRSTPHPDPLLHFLHHPLAATVLQIIVPRPRDLAGSDTGHHPRFLAQTGYSTRSVCPFG